MPKRTPWGETAARDDRPASSTFEESRNTLTYAGRAKNIKTRVKQNLLSVSYHIAQYTNIIADLRGEIQRLKCKIEKQGGRSPDRAQLERGDTRHIQAEVQLHSGRGEQAAMEHLREQLISTFQEQMDIRRRLLELENRGMELQMDSSCHLLTITGWKRKKSRQALKWREERRKESFTKDDTGKDLDTGDGQPDIKEPAEVVSARKSIATFMTEQKKLRKQKDSTLPKISPPGTVPTPEESDLENVKMPNSESPHQHRSFLPLLSTESEANHLLKASSRAWQAKGSFVPTPPPIPASNLVTQEATTQVALNGQINFSPESMENLSEIPLTCKGKKETPTDTKGISVKAAPYRLQALGAEGRQLLAPTMRHSSLSLYSLGETDDMQLPGLLACKRPPSPTLQHTASEDSLSSSTGEAPSQAVERHGDGPCPTLQGQKKSLSKKREESLEAKRKRKSQSFEVTGQGTPTQIPAHPALQPALLSRPKMHVAGLRPVENHISDQRMPVIGHLTPTIRPLGKAMLPMATVKLPPCQNLGPEDPSPLAVPSNPLGVSGRVSRMRRLPYGTNTQGKDGRFQHN